MLHVMFEHMAPLIVTFTPCIRAFTTKSSSLSTDVYYLLRGFFFRAREGCKGARRLRASAEREIGRKKITIGRNPSAFVLFQMPCS